MRHIRNASFLGLLVALTPACLGGSGPSEPRSTSFASALPSPEDVELRVPGGDANPNALMLGDTAKFYLETYQISHDVNGTVYGILSVLRDVVSLPPTRHTDNQAVWGPWTGALEPATYELVVQAEGDNTYSYSLLARPRASTSDADFVAVIEGTAQPAPQPGQSGSGHFSVDWTTIASLNPAVHLEGSMAVDYRHEGLSWRTVEMYFQHFRDLEHSLSAEPTDVLYRYLENPDLSGEFQFAYQANIHSAAEMRPEPETIRIRSRWLSTGSGRADVQVSSDEIAADLLAYLGLEQDYVAATECWDDNFLRTYYNESPLKLTEDDGDPPEGSVDGPGQGSADACPFADSLFADDDVTVTADTQ